MSNIIKLRNTNWTLEPREPSAPVVIPKKQKLADRYHSLAQMAKRFSVGYDLLYKAVRRKDLEAVVIGRSYRVTEEAVQKFLDLCGHKKRLG